MMAAGLLSVVPVDVLIKQLPHGQDLPIPRCQPDGSGGLDRHPAVENAMAIEPGTVARVPCGFQLAIPEGYEGQVRPRSGLALKGITVANTPGTIDCDYRGELNAIL